MKRRRHLADRTILGLICLALQPLLAGSSTAMSRGPSCPNYRQTRELYTTLRFKSKKELDKGFKALGDVEKCILYAGTHPSQNALREATELMILSIPYDQFNDYWEELAYAVYSRNEENIVLDTISHFDGCDQSLFKERLYSNLCASNSKGRILTSVEKKFIGCRALSHPSTACAQRYDPFKLRE